MPQKLSIKSALFALSLLTLPGHLAAQSAEEVKSDVLSALSTPLPITVVGPLLTRDVVVVEEGNGFRATLQDTSLMGLFPFGEVSLKLEPLENNTYRVSDLQFPKELDFPGLARITLENMALDGVWSASDRSYSSLNAQLSGVRVRPGQGGASEISLGRFGFDVAKEPDETDMESRFDITLADVSATGFGPNDTRVGEAQLLLRANGERPVDLYSLLREVIMVAGRNDGGMGLQTLGQSLLGNTYGTVALDFKMNDLSITDTLRPKESYFKAAGLHGRLGMKDVAPRDWGMAEVMIELENVAQQDLFNNSIFGVERARVGLRGEEMPVADLFKAITTLNARNQMQPVLVTDILDGFLEFGAVEFATEGSALNIVALTKVRKNDKWVEVPEFTLNYESWELQSALEDLNKNEGNLTTLIDLAGGSVVPGPHFAKEAQPHINAWFPVSLRAESEISNLNEGFLKALFKDVFIEDLREPVEILLPLALFASASAFDVNIEGNHYETALFRVEQTGNYQFFPAKVLSLMPLEGDLTIKMRGYDALVSYLEELRLEEAGRKYGAAEEVSMMKSVLTVLRNLGTSSDEGSIVWAIEVPNVERSEIVINGTTLYYPDLGQFLPFAALGASYGLSGL